MQTLLRVGTSEINKFMSLMSAEEKVLKGAMDTALDKRNEQAHAMFAARRKELLAIRKAFLDIAEGKSIDNIES